MEDFNTFEFHNIRPEELGLQLKKIKGLKGIEAVVKIHKTATGIAADFKIDFSIEFQCVRCLKIIADNHVIGFHLDYISGKDPLIGLEKVELRSGDVDKVYYQGPHIDVGVGIREAIVLSLPIAPLCSPECRGLCPICGQNLNEKKCTCHADGVGRFTLRAADFKPDKCGPRRKKRENRENRRVKR